MDTKIQLLSHTHIPAEDVPAPVSDHFDLEALDHCPFMRDEIKEKAKTSSLCYFL